MMMHLIKVMQRIVYAGSNCECWLRRLYQCREPGINQGLKYTHCYLQMYDGIAIAVPDQSSGN